jgi:NADH:ubiquinone oxidoreductase subunit 6 (subunit J)
LAALLCAAAGGITTNRAALGSAAAFAGIVLVFASVTPVIWPSPLSAGSLFCYLGAIAIAVPFIVALSITEVVRLTTKTGEASCGVQAARS